jgi:hypothetical protein
LVLGVLEVLVAVLLTEPTVLILFLVLLLLWVEAAEAVMLLVYQAL